MAMVPLIRRCMLHFTHIPWYTTIWVLQCKHVLKMRNGGTCPECCIFQFSYSDHVQGYQLLEKWTCDALKAYFKIKNTDIIWPAKGRTSSKVLATMIASTALILGTRPVAPPTSVYFHSNEILYLLCLHKPQLCN